jgi:hypothetical protein
MNPLNNWEMKSGNRQTRVLRAAFSDADSKRGALRAPRRLATHKCVTTGILHAEDGFVQPSQDAFV